MNNEFKSDRKMVDTDDIGQLVETVRGIRSNEGRWILRWAAIGAISAAISAIVAVAHCDTPVVSTEDSIVWIVKPDGSLRVFEIVKVPVCRKSNGDLYQPPCAASDERITQRAYAEVFSLGAVDDFVKRLQPKP